MVTNRPDKIVTDTERVAPTADHDAISTVMNKVRQAICGFHGHDTLLHFERGRMLLKCASCGHETPGWEISRTRPALRLRGDAQRHATSRQVLVEKRIA
jgi:hypothetical protein